MELIGYVIKDFQEIKAEQFHDGCFIIYLCNSEKDKIIVGKISDDEIASQIFKKNIDEITKDDWDWYDEQLGTYDKESYAKRFWNEAVVERGHLRDSVKKVIKNLKVENTKEGTAFLTKLKKRYGINPRTTEVNNNKIRK